MLPLTLDSHDRVDADAAVPHDRRLQRLLLGQGNSATPAVRPVLLDIVACDHRCVGEWDVMHHVGGHPDRSHRRTGDIMIRLRSKETTGRLPWRDIRERCEQLIETLPIPEPFDIPIFLSRLAARRGRRIELIAAALPSTPLCGMLVSTGDADYIVHAVDTTPLHAQHIDMHEVGHLLLGHTSSTGVAGGRQVRPDVAEQEAVRALLPSLSPALIRRVLGRTTYSDADECEAELFASMLLARVASPVMAMAGRASLAERLSRSHQPWAA